MSKLINRISLFLFISMVTFSCRNKTPVNFIEDFESNMDVRGWKFISDINTGGSLDFVKVEEGSAAYLTCNVPKIGKWVGAQKFLETVPANAIGIRLKLKCPATATAWLFLTDSTGRNYKHRLARSLSDMDDSKWFSITVAFSTKPDSISGGAFIPDIQKSLKSLIVAVEPRADILLSRSKSDVQSYGEMWFDNVEWISDFIEPISLIENKKDTMSAATLWNKTGVCTHFEHGDLGRPDLINAVGFNAIRGDASWEAVEAKKGQFNFHYFDSIVTVAEKNKLRSLFILCYGNKLYSKGTSDGLVTTEQINAFGHYCANMVRHYKGKPVDFEIWNEPNHEWFWKPMPNAIEFANLLKVALDSIKKANPTVTVISGGTAGIDWRFIKALGENNALTGFDGIGIHPYVDGSPESISEDLVCLRHLMKKYFKKVPKEWATECGAISSKYGNGLSHSAQLWQARLDVRTILANWMAGFAYSHKYEFFCTSDSVDHQANYGIIGFNVKPRPAYHAIQTLKQLTENRQLAGRIPTQNSGAYALQFNGEKDRLFVLWTSAGKLVSDTTGFKTHFILPKQPSAIVNFLGEKMPVPKNENGKWIVETDGEVVYALLPK